MSLGDRIRQHGGIPKWSPRPEVLLCPQIPKPMHGLNPRTIKGKTWWDKERKKAFHTTQQHCIACSVHKDEAKGPKWLEGHELYETKYREGKLIYIETIPLCHYCHNYIHKGRMEILLGIGKLSHGKYARVINHGNKVLRLAKLTPSPVWTGTTAEWGDWRLVLDGVEYPPLFANQEDWLKHYSNIDIKGME